MTSVLSLVIQEYGTIVEQRSTALLPSIFP
jgi:hypothetical protein